MFKPIPKNIREEILTKIKNGEPVASVATQYAVSTKTIYAWMSDNPLPRFPLWR